MQEKLYKRGVLERIFLGVVKNERKTAKGDLENDFCMGLKF